MGLLSDWKVAGSSSILAGGVDGALAGKLAGNVIITGLLANLRSRN